MDIDTFLTTYQQEFISIRRRLHELAELSTMEYKTGAYLTSLLTQWNIPYQYPVAGTGVIATIRGKAPGKGAVVALRADMDALPLLEDASCPFASKTPGVMHACGHDAHMTIALGAARFFHLLEHSFSGCIRIFFQPAEETVGGALPMVKAGCMEHPKVDYVLGLHMAPYLEIGNIQVKYGSFYASSDEVTLTVQGKSAHGAYPDMGVDAIVIAAHLICALQTLVSRSISPLDQCVLTLGTIAGGTAHNILADTVTLTGALRTTNASIRQQAKDFILRQAKDISHGFGGTCQVSITPGYDAVVNDDFLVDELIALAAPLLGKEQIHLKSLPGMGVEDFSFFQQKAPGLFYHLGCGNKKRGISAPLHSREFALDEDSIALGIRLQTALTQVLLRKPTE